MSDDLNRLAADLGHVPVALGKEVLAGLKGTAHNMKESWAAKAAGPSGGHARHYPRAIDYDVRTNFANWSAEIGPSLGRVQGGLGILEDAPGGVTAAPQNLRPQVVSDNEADFERGMNNAVDDALKRHGL